MSDQPVTEFGAQVISTEHNVYLHDYNRAVVDRFIEDMAAVTPVCLVTRQWNGGTHTGWVRA